MTNRVFPIILTCGDRDPSGQANDVKRQFGRCHVYRDNGLGAAMATRSAIQVALGLSGIADHILFMEDDVELHQTASRTVKSTEFPDQVGIISFCDMREMRHNTKDGLYIRDAIGCDGRGWWGNQAILLHRETARLAVDKSWFSDEICKFPSVAAHSINFGDNGINCSDIRLSLIVHRYGGARNKYAVSVPSVFRHAGYTSKCFPDRLPELGERETKNWIGDRK